MILLPNNMAFIEAGGIPPSTDSFPRLPVLPAVVKPEVRLVTVLLDIESITQLAGKQRDIRDGNRKVIREALEYVPLLLMESEKH